MIYTREQQEYTPEAPPQNLPPPKNIVVVPNDDGTRRLRRSAERASRSSPSPPSPSPARVGAALSSEARADVIEPPLARADVIEPPLLSSLLSVPPPPSSSDGPPRPGLLLPLPVPSLDAVAVIAPPEPPARDVVARAHRLERVLIGDHPQRVHPRVRVLRVVRRVGRHPAAARACFLRRRRRRCSWRRDDRRRRTRLPWRRGRRGWA